MVLRLNSLASRTRGARPAALEKVCNHSASANPSTGIYAEIEATIRRYIGTKVAISTVTGLLVWGILAMFGLRLAFMFGMLAFLLNFIPSIGSVLATLLPIPVAVAQFQDPVSILAVVALRRRRSA